MSTVRGWVWACALATLGAAGCSWDWDGLEPRPGVVGDAGDLGSDLGPADVPMDVPSMDVSDGACACRAGELCCGSVCVNPSSDPSHCGQCGMRCPGTVCVSGACSGTCLLGQLDCDRNASNGCEVNGTSDNANCGACGVACPTGRTCVGGACVCPPRTGDCDSNPANACETDTGSDPNHCGGCGMRCPSGQACSMGLCACSGGQGDCDDSRANGCETNLQTSASHCGACGRSCGSGAVCVMGACQCIPGSQRCPATAETCLVSTLDPANCGACGRACSGSTPLCSARGCVADCAAGETRCGMACADLATSPTHCGACGRACGAHQTCTGATPACACEAGWGDCDGNPANGCETDLANSAANCGACGTSCGEGRTCSAGVCTCVGGLRDCGGGRCAACCSDGDCGDGVDCTVDRCEAGRCTNTMCAHCCGSTCRDCCADTDCSMNRGCGLDGRCSTCVTGYGDCDGNATNGCETRLDSVTHCGACGTSCSVPNGTASCATGRCSVGMCTTGYADCDGEAANGCEVNLDSSTLHCGRCGNECMFAGGTAACVRGSCQRTSCDTGLGDCDGNTANGCEANLRESATNCGACGTACVVPNATPVCRAGTCGVGVCTAGYGDCDGTPGNGCEVNVQTSATHCGTCGATCSVANATPACRAGACAVGTCNAGFGDCNSGPTDGCETNLRTSTANCGTCGTACPSRANATTACVTGSCGYTCSDGFGDCDGSTLSGCETDLASSTGHCGGCGRACAPPNATGVCSGGSCGVGTCSPGFQNCNTTVSDGCEVNTLSDVSNCGGCGRACTLANAASACLAGSCSISTCNTGYSDCDRVGSNGCEVSILTSAANCGACGHACEVGRTCVLGRCTRTFTGYNVTTPPSEVVWVDACAAPGARRVLVSLDDDRYADTLPFPVEVWGGQNLEYVVSTNGWVGFGTYFYNLDTLPTVAPFNSFGSLPGSGAPYPSVFSFGVDLVMRFGGVCVATVGTAPSRRFVVEHYDAMFWGTVFSSTHFTFELIAYEDSANLDLLYNNPWAVPAGLTVSSPGDVTIGLQDHRAPPRGVMYFGSVAPGTRVRFAPLP